MEEFLKLAAGVAVLVISATILLFCARMVWRNRNSDRACAENRSALREVLLEGMVYLLVLSAAAAFVLYRYAGGT